MTNTGKIGRLPGHLREQLNRHLNAGYRLAPLVRWLNGLPEVQDLLARHFGAHPINPRNLREWIARAYPEWKIRDHIISPAAAMHAHSNQNQTDSTGKLTQKTQALLELLSLHRHGKIASLPPELLHELNHRLWNGAIAAHLLRWLNGLSEVQAILARDFAGRPINAVNLAKWKHGGYRDWQLQYEIAEKIRAGIRPKSSQSG